MPQPRCDVFGTCGGCALQDMEHNSQIEMKKAAVIEDFLRQKIVLDPAVKVFFKDDYHYRNRMDFPFSPGGPGQRMKGRFDKIVHFRKCYIANSGINTVFDEVQQWFDSNKEHIDVFDVVKRTGTFRYATIRSGFYSGENSITFIFNENSLKMDGQKALLEAFAVRSAVKNILLGFVKYNTDQSAIPGAQVIKGGATISEKLGPYMFNFHTQGFFQSNSAVFMDIIHWIRERIKLPYDILLDLYGGVGTLGISLMDAVKEVFIVDNNPLNAASAVKNIETNKAANVKVFAADAEKTAELGIGLTGKRSVFVLDPPRNGIHRKVYRYIAETRPEKIFYVSCNHKTQAEDLRKLMEIYDLKDFAMFDMFPQTKHIETAAELELKKGS
jgi:23S rRNA (uracil-5-)-methyltransferase RumA